MKSLDDRASGWFDPQTVVGSTKAQDDLRRQNKVDWINPISMSMLQKAVNRKAETVVMNGIEFAITYGIIIELLDGPRECVKLKRTDGAYVPIGYISVNRIKRFQFEDDDS